MFNNKSYKIGIRLEDKKYETRVPLIPFDVEDLLQEYPWLEIQIERNRVYSPTEKLYPRAFSDVEYEKAGAKVVESLNECQVILGIKEIPKHKILPNKTYVFFSHTYKGQPYNKEMFIQLIDNNCNLVDYELIVEDETEYKFKKTKILFHNIPATSRFDRTVMFGKHAGIVGAINSFVAFGKRCDFLGIDTPFKNLKTSLEYRSNNFMDEGEYNHTTNIHDLEIAINDLRKISKTIKMDGINKKLLPLIVGITGKSSKQEKDSLNLGVSAAGAKEVIDYLNPIIISPQELVNFKRPIEEQEKNIYVVYFDRNDTQIDKLINFEQPYNFENYLTKLSVLLNCMKWNENEQWRLITRQMLKNIYNMPEPHIKIIGDITCDPGGGIEVCFDTYSDVPYYIYLPDKDVDYSMYWSKDNDREKLFNMCCVQNSVEGHGVVLMTITNLPCQFPKEASRKFSHLLRKYVPDISRIDNDYAFENLRGIISRPIRRAMLVYKGQVAKDYEYLLDLYKISQNENLLQ